MAFSEVNESNVYLCAGSPSPSLITSMMNALMTDSFNDALMSMISLFFSLIHRNNRDEISQSICTSRYSPLDFYSNSSYGFIFRGKDLYLQAIGRFRVFALFYCSNNSRYRLSVSCQEKIQVGSLVSIFIQAKQYM